MIRSEFEIVVRQLIDDPNGVQWSDTNLGLLTDTQQARLWKRIHEHQPFFTSALTVVTPLTTPGYIDIATGGDLTAGDLLRVQSLVRDGLPYPELDPSGVVIENDEVQAQRTGTATRQWVRLGDQLHILPYGDLTTDTEVRYSFLPPKFSGLAAGGEVLWPEGHELALAMQVATICLAKGAREDISSMAALARLELQDMLAWVGRLSLGALTPFYHDSLSDWAGD
jgi:hypothetical protein